MDKGFSSTLDEPAFPEDSGLPALALLDRGADQARLAALGIVGANRRAVVLSHHRAKRCTVRVVTDDGVCIVKVFDRNAARVYAVLVAVAEADLEGVRVPGVLGFDPDLELLVTDEFPPETLADLVAAGDGARAGSLAAAWVAAVQHAEVDLGRPQDPLDSVAKMGRRAATFRDRPLAERFEAALARLAASVPAVERRVLAHASLRLEHLHDCGDAVGLIDWDGYRQAPPEYDAGTFLASTVRFATENPACAPAAAQARAAFLDGCGAVLDPGRLVWFEALALAKVIGKLGQLPHVSSASVHAVLDQAAALVP